LRLTIRADDLGWDVKQPDKIDRGLSLARRFHDAMQGVPYLGAVIPSCVDADGRAWLRSRPKGLTVAMHGVTHNMVSPGVESEFAGLTRTKCMVMIGSGQRRLGVPTQHFVAPFNHYGEFLGDALADCGIIYHWYGDTPEQEPMPPKRSERFVWIPVWRPLYGMTAWRVADDRPSILDVLAGLNGSIQSAIVTLHITWEAAFPPEFDGVREFVKTYGQHVITPDEYVGKCFK